MNKNRMLSVSEVVAQLPEEARKIAYRVGSWVWIGFGTKPQDGILDKLKELGFHWNGERKVWQHPCGVFRKKAPYDPRKKYGVVQVVDESEN